MWTGILRDIAGCECKVNVMQHVLCSMSAGPDLSNQNVVCPSVLPQCMENNKEKIIIEGTS